ncbi:myb-related transcription factor, partner of profilin-like [Ambystoma mexicanum]|uniref:myb-related transcription factor, partner of profilin-like n=1 Tax=Ambystoma mexicanum TaxID=8296 RepID=UPI0037E7D69C
MASRLPARRQRKQHFSEAELTVLVEHIVKHAEMLFSADQRRATQQRRKEVWAEAAHKCTAVGMTTHTMKDCHKRWDDLRLRVCNLIAAHRQHSTGTGGGPASPLKLQSWKERCSSVLHLEGIHGVGDAEAGMSPPADAAVSSDSDNGQEATQRPPARAQCSTPAQEDDASCSGTQAPAASGTPAPGASGTPAPAALGTPADATIPMQGPSMAPDAILQPICTAEEAASSDDSTPAMQAEVVQQGEGDNTDELSSIHGLQFNPQALHSPMRSPTPSTAELSTRLQRI